MNAYVRMKLALTEDVPTIKPYDEARWAELFDGKRLPISSSLDLLETLHKRWVLMLKSVSYTHLDVYKRQTYCCAAASEKKALQSNRRRPNCSKKSLS